MIRAAALFVGVSVALSACTTTLVDPARCQTSAECRAAFGLGHECRADGLCAEITLPPRCETVYPPQLFAEHTDAEPVVFGVLTDRSEQAEVVAERAVRLVALLANQQGGLQSRSVGMVFCDVQADHGQVYRDNQSRAEAVLAATRLLVNTIGVQGLIGPHSSSDVQNTFAQVVNDAPVLVMSPSATSTALTALNPTPATDTRPGFLWRTVPPETEALSAMAASLAARSVPGVFVVAPDGVGQASVTALQGALASLGSAAQVDSGYYPAGERPAMIDAINRAAESPAAREVVFLGDSPSAAITFLTLVAGDDRFASRTIFMDQSAAVPEILMPAAAALFGRGTNGYSLRIVRYRVPDTVTYRNFRNQYRAEYMNQDPVAYATAARTHDAAWLMLLGSAGGLARSGTINALSIGLGLRQLSDPEAAPVSLEQSSWPAAQRALMGGATLRVVGASGELNFDRRTGQLHGAPEVLVVDGAAGAWSFVQER